jgi:hypothetical protein
VSGTNYLRVPREPKNMTNIWKIFTDYLLIPLVGIFFIAFLLLIALAPEKNHLKYYEIDGWGKYVCKTDYTWGNKVVNRECWLLTVEDQMKGFIETWNKNK